MSNQELIAKIKDHCRRGGSTAGLRELMNQYPHRYVWKVFVGQAKEQVKHIPNVIGTYETNNHGTLQTYQESTAAVGDVFIRDDGINNGCVLTVIVNKGTTGDAWMPSTYYYVAIEIPEPPLPEKPCDDDMVNAKEEFIKEIENRTVLCAIVSHDNEEYFLPENYTQNEYAAFLQNLNFVYDSGYGVQKVGGLIWYTDGTWSERYVYDGSEYWVWQRVPEIPKELKRG